MPQQNRAGGYIYLLIGQDTYTKTTFVKWEVEVAIEKGCRLIGINLNSSRFKDYLCPWFFADRGALLSFHSHRVSSRRRWNGIRLRATRCYPDDWIFFDSLYTALGYTLNGNSAVLPPPPNPFATGKPPWAK